MFFIFLLVISLKLFYSLQEPQLNVVIGWCRSGWVWCSAISFYDVFLEFLGRFWCQLGHDDSESHFFPLSFDIISWFKVQTAEFTSHCLSFSHLFEWSPSLWLAARFFIFLFANFSTKFSIIEVLKFLTNICYVATSENSEFFFQNFHSVPLIFPELLIFSQSVTSAFQ